MILATNIKCIHTKFEALKHYETMFDDVLDRKQSMLYSH